MAGRGISSRRINLVAGALLVCIAVLAGSTVFWVMERHAERLLRDNLQLSLKGRAESIDVEVSAAANKMASIPERAFLIDPVSRLDADAADKNALRDLREYFLPAMQQLGLSAVEISGRDGKQLAGMGSFAQAPTISIPLMLPGNLDLLWKDGFVLQARNDILEQGKRIGSIRTQIGLPGVSKSFRSASSLGHTGDQAMCASSGARMLCFPTTLSHRPTSYPKRSSSGALLPMVHALEGKSGSIVALDYRRQEVVAAFRPLGSTGLGMVLKQDSSELYATIWDQLNYLLPISAGILLLALLLLRWQLRPLVTGLVRSEREAHGALARLQDSEGQVAANEARLAEILDSATDAIVSVDDQQNVIVFNKAAESIFGYRAADMLGQPLERLLPARLRENHRRLVGAFGASGQSAREMGAGRELMALRANGEEFPIEASSIASSTVAGSKFFTVIMRDITERKQSEQLLRQNADRTRRILHASAVGLWEWNLLTNEMYFSPEWKQQLGYADDEILDDFDEWQKRVHPEDLGRALAAVDDFREGRVPSYAVEVRLRHRDGSWRWIYGEAELEHNENGEPVTIRGSQIDVTERVHSAQVQAALFNISVASHESNDLDDLYRRVHVIVGELMAARNFYIAMLDEVNDQISFDYWVDEIEESSAPLRFSDGIGLTDWVLRSGKPLLVFPQLNREGLPDGLTIIGAQGVDWLGVPLKVLDKTIGVLAVQNYTGDVHYEQRHLELLQFVSDQIAAAIERKRQADTIRKSEEMYRTLFDQGPVYITLIQLPEGRFVEINDACLAAFGYDREEVIGRSSLDFGAWQDPKLREQFFSLLRDKGHVSDFAAVMLRKDRTPIDVLLTSKRITIGGNDFVLNMLQDTTERKQAELRLRESQEQFKSAFESSALGIALVALDGRYLKVNASLCTFTGYGEQELLAMTFQHITHPDDLDAERNLDRELLAGEIEKYRLEKRYFRKDGSLVWARLAVSLVRDESGQPEYFISQSEDISATVIAQQSLEQANSSLAQTQHLLEASQYAAQVGGWELDVASGNLFWTNETYRIHDLSPDDYTPSVDTAINFYTPESLQVVTAALQLAKDEGTPYDLELELISAQGRHVCVRTTGSATQVRGRTIRIGGAIQDITERKRAEQWQQHYSQVLAMISAEASLVHVLEELARFVEKQSQGSSCSILLLSYDGMRLTHGAAPSLPDFYNNAIHGVAIGPTVGSCGAAAALAQAVITEDIQTSPNWTAWRQIAARAGLRSCWSTPIFSSEHKVMGTFALYHGEPWSPTPVDEELLRRAAALAALAIDRARHQDAQRLAKTVFEQNIEGVMVTSPDARILMVNPAFERLTGYSAEEAVGQTPTLLDSGRHDEAFWAAIRAQLAQTGRWEGEVRHRRKNGEIYPVQMVIADVRDAAGVKTQCISSMADLSLQKVQASRIEQLAFYDALTGLPNRALFLDRLENILASAERQDHRGALLFMDLDHFKEINDSKGHAIGDLALAETARRFLTACRREETLARLGGDEFVLIAEGADHHSAALVATRLLQSLSKPLMLMGAAHSIGISIGIALYPEDGTTTEELIKHTDIAMYRAKAAGGGYRFYQADMSSELEKHLGIVQRLGTAMEADQLQLYYQPKIELATGKLVGAEALLRWHDADLGWISPAEFIPIAEQRGMMGKLGDWVLRQACMQLTEWRNRGIGLPGRLSFNVSARQIEDPEIVGRMLEIVHEAGGSPTWLELELTESSMMSDPEQSIEIMEYFAAAGFGLSIDDFGTGYSSLAYLKRFAADELKIDISFVRNMLTDADDYAIVSTIITMAHGFGMTTAAEGVELEGQAEALKALRCDIAQGYLYSRPEAPDIFAEKWLGAERA